MKPSTRWIILAIAVASLAIGGWIWRHHHRVPSNPVSDKLAATVRKIDQANLSLPERQVQAKSLVFAVFIEKGIPPAASWCDELNLGNKLWPALPTNTIFAMNAAVGGRKDLRAIPADTVIFFEAASPGWNQSGGSEMLSGKDSGIAIATMDGRALTVTKDEALKLRWQP